MGWGDEGIHVREQCRKGKKARVQSVPKGTVHGVCLGKGWSLMCWSPVGSYGSQGGAGPGIMC